MTEVKAFGEMNKEEQEAFLVERKRLSADRYNVIKAENDKLRKKRKAFKAKVHAGNQFLQREIAKIQDERGGEDLKLGIEKIKEVLDEKLQQGAIAKLRKETCGDVLIEGKYSIGDFEITFGVLPVSVTDDVALCKAAYTIKSPTDEYDPNVAMGLIGARIMNTDEWCATLEVPRDVLECDPQILRKALANIIDSRILLRAPEVPQRVINRLFKPSITAWDKKLKEDSKPSCEPCNEQGCASCQE